ncbi:MAG: DNA-protecting protein DprA [Holophagaceae bacterium]|nr:DNA-protecting protein DprA [Holophagaceae bacterium]
MLPADHLDLLAMAFAILPWPEARKAALWELAQGEGRVPAGVADLDRVAADLPRRKAEALSRGARLLLPSDPEVAALMASLPYPVALWVRGTLPPPGPRLAVVGARKATGIGLARARAWCKTFAEAGVAVLSGLARGIDGAAHEGALEAAGPNGQSLGRTWGVLGSGLDHPYPPEHRDLMARMVVSGGGVLTPFPPEALPQKWHFPRRNLLLAAWTEGVLVIEAATRSGSLVTAKLAADLGREVWACPGGPEEPLSEGPNGLLRDGARLVRNPLDLLEDLGLG